MTIVHRITGYDKRTERLAIEHPIPEGELAAIRSIARVPPEDAHALGSYPLDTIAARHIAGRLDRTLNLDHYDWFLEPFTLP